MGGSFEGCWGSVQKVVFRIAWRWFQNFAGDAICVIIYFIAFHCIILLSGFRFERKKLSLLLLVICVEITRAHSLPLSSGDALHQIKTHAKFLKITWCQNRPRIALKRWYYQRRQNGPLSLWGVKYLAPQLRCHTRPNHPQQAFQSLPCWSSKLNVFKIAFRLQMWPWIEKATCNGRRVGAADPKSRKNLR